MFIFPSLTGELLYFSTAGTALVSNLWLVKGALRMAKMSGINATGVLTKICITLNRMEKINQRSISDFVYCTDILTLVRWEGVPCNIGSCYRKGCQASPPVCLFVYS